MSFIASPGSLFSLPEGVGFEIVSYLDAQDRNHFGCVSKRARAQALDLVARRMFSLFISFQHKLSSYLPRDATPRIEYPLEWQFKSDIRAGVFTKGKQLHQLIVRLDDRALSELDCVLGEMSDSIEEERLEWPVYDAGVEPFMGMRCLSIELQIAKWRSSPHKASKPNDFVLIVSRLVGIQHYDRVGELSSLAVSPDSRALVDIVMLAAQGLFKDAVTKCSQIKDHTTKNEALKILVWMMAQAGKIEDGTKLCKTIRSEKHSNSSLGYLAVCEAKNGRISKSLELLDSMGAGQAYFCSLVTICKIIERLSCLEGLQIDEMLRRTQHLINARSGLDEALQSLLRAALKMHSIDEVLGKVERLVAPEIQGVALRELAGIVARIGQIDKARNIIAAMTDVSEKAVAAQELETFLSAKALKKKEGVLPLEGKANDIAEMLSLAHKITDQNTKDKALQDIAPLMVRQGYPMEEVLAVLDKIQNPGIKGNAAFAILSSIVKIYPYEKARSMFSSIYPVDISNTRLILEKKSLDLLDILLRQGCSLDNALEFLNTIPEGDWKDIGLKRVAQWFIGNIEASADPEAASRDVLRTIAQIKDPQQKNLACMSFVECMVKQKKWDEALKVAMTIQDPQAKEKIVLECARAIAQDQSGAVARSYIAKWTPRMLCAKICLRLWATR